MDQNLQRSKNYLFQIIKIKKFGKKCNSKYNTWKSMDDVHKRRLDGCQKLE
jgi:hypothetical protein